MDDGCRPVTQLRHDGRDHAAGIRRDRYGRGRRGDDPDDPLVQRTGRYRRSRISARDEGDVQARHRVRGLDRTGAPLFPSLWSVRRDPARGRLPSSLAESASGGVGRFAERTVARHATRGEGAVREARGRCAIDPVDARLRLSLRCRAIRRVSAPTQRGSGCHPHRRHVATHRARRRNRLRHGTVDRAWRTDRGRPVHRLLGVSGPVDRRRNGRRL